MKNCTFAFINSISVRKTYNLIFIFLVVIISLPVLQQVIGFPKIAGLKGYFTEAKKPVLKTKNLWNGTYQDSLNKYVEDHIGFRPDLVRINNTVDYYLYGKINANNVILGKENYTFEEGYINATLGRDFIGDKAIKEKAKKAAFLQQYYKKKNIELLYLFAPGKATFYPEYIPEEYNPDSLTTTNYEFYIEEFRKNDISFIDYNAWFLQMKDTSQYPLYPQYGIHWSRYGMTLAFDSLVHYLENKKGKDMVRPVWDHIEVTKHMQGTDYDLGKALNLLWQLPTYDMAYPKIKWDKNEDFYTPDVACISDSYFWNWYGTGMTTQVFNKTNFLYYYNQHYSSEWRGVRDTDDLQIIPFFEDHDIILVMFTDGNLKKMAYGFIDQMYNNLSTDSSQLLSFSFMDHKYTHFSESDSTYVIKKGTPLGKTVLKTKDLKISPNTSYVISYEAKGFQILEMDFYPNSEIAVNANTKIDSEKWQQFFWQFNSGNYNGINELRVYMDYRPEFTENTYIRNIRISKVR